MSYVSKILKLNSFLVDLINEIIGKVLLKFQNPKVVSTVSGKETVIILPFVGPDSFTLKSSLLKLYGQCFPQFKLKVIFKVDRRISGFFRVKDVIPVEWKSHVVYELSCDACNASYIGKTVLSIPCVRGSFLGLMLILNLTKNLSPLLSFTLGITPPILLIVIKSKF